MAVTRDEFIAVALRDESDSCVIWPFAIRQSSGYPAHSYRVEGKKINVDAHRYVCELAHGEPKDGLQAAHRCGNKSCINPQHLYWATPLENMADAKKHGTLRGGGIYRQYITKQDVKRICSSSKSLIQLAREYGSDPSYIGRIRRQYSGAAA